MVPSGIDRERLMLQLGRLEEHLFELEEIKVSLQTRKDEDILISAAERILHLAIEDCLNIGSHIISGKGFRRADTYKEIFVILGAEKVLSKELSIKMAQLASFRNRLVHLYWKVEPAEVTEKIKDSGVFRQYAEAINNFIRK